MRALRLELVEHLWKITEELNILYKENWTALADKEVIKFQRGLLQPLGGSKADKSKKSNDIRVAIRDNEADEEDADRDVDEEELFNYGSGSDLEEGLAWTFFTSFLYSLSLITTVGELRGIRGGLINARILLPIISSLEMSKTFGRACSGIKTVINLFSRLTSF